MAQRSDQSTPASTLRAGCSRLDEDDAEARRFGYESGRDFVATAPDGGHIRWLLAVRADRLAGKRFGNIATAVHHHRRDLLPWDPAECPRCDVDPVVYWDAFVDGVYDFWRQTRGRWAKG